MVLPLLLDGLSLGGGFAAEGGIISAVRFAHQTALHTGRLLVTAYSRSLQAVSLEDAACDALLLSGLIR